MAEFNEKERLHGKWIHGPNKGLSGWIVAYRAGSLSTTNDNNEEGWGAPPRLRDKRWAEWRRDS